MACGEINNELKSLWENRASLSSNDWTRLRELIHRCLQSSGKVWSLYNSLRGDEPLADYIDHYIVDRVFMPTTRGGEHTAKLVHANALIGFFLNYLTDFYRRGSRRVDRGVAGYEVEDREETGPLHQSEGEVAAPSNLGEVGIEPLEQFGLSSERVADAAREWLLAQEEWARLYLALNHCLDKWEGMPLYKLAELHQIPAYHSKARQLGITSKKGGFEAYDDFEQTMLGRWIASLPIEVNPENYDAMRDALEILCSVALSVHGVSPGADV